MYTAVFAAEDPKGLLTNNLYKVVEVESDILPPPGSCIVLGYNDTQVTVTVMGNPPRFYPEINLVVIWVNLLPKWNEENLAECRRLGWVNVSVFADMLKTRFTSRKDPKS